MPTRPFHDPRASAEESRCPRNSASDAGTSARHADHGRDQEQHDRDEEDDLGDFDGGSGDPAQVSILLVAADEKRLHTFKELRHATEGWLSATSENMTIHIDMAARKTAPFPPDIRARIQALADAHATIPRPEGIGRKVAMPSK